MHPQSGTLNRPPEHLLIAGLNFAAAGMDACRKTVATLQTLIIRELTSDWDDLTTATDRSIPSVETGARGYYFIPAISGPRKPWSWVLPYSSPA